MMCVEQKLLRPMWHALKIQVHKFSLSLALLMPATQATTVKQFGTKSSFVIHWIDFYPVDSTIQPLNNRGLVIAPVHNTKKLPTLIFQSMVA